MGEGVAGCGGVGEGGRGEDENDSGSRGEAEGFRSILLASADR